MSGRTDRRTVSDHNTSPWAFGSGELKIEEICFPEYWRIWKRILHRGNYPDSMATTSVILELPRLKNGAWLFYKSTLDFFFDVGMLRKGLFIFFIGKCFQMSAQIDGDRLNSSHWQNTQGTSGPMLSASRKIWRKQIIFPIKFGSIEEAETYLHGTTFPIIHSSL